MPEARPSARYWPRGSRWQRSLRSTTKTSGSRNTRGSRLRGRCRTLTSAPSGSRRPNRSTSWRAKRGAREHRRGVPQGLQVGELARAADRSDVLQLVRVGEQQEPEVGQAAVQRLVVGLPEGGHDVLGGGRAALDLEGGRWPNEVVAWVGAPLGEQRLEVAATARSPPCSPSRCARGSQPAPRCIRQYRSANSGQVAGGQIEHGAPAARVGAARRTQLRGRVPAPRSAEHPLDDLLGVRVDPVGLGPQDGQLVAEIPAESLPARRTTASTGSRSWRRR